MKLADLSFLAVRLLAIYVLYDGIRQATNVYYIMIPGWLELDLDFDFAKMAILHMLPSVVVLGFGIVLWIFARKWSFLIIGMKPEDAPSDPAFKSTYQMLISLVGLAIIAVSLGNLCYFLPSFLTLNAYVSNPLKLQSFYQVIAEAVKIILGICFILRANDIRRMLERVIERNK